MKIFSENKKKFFSFFFFFLPFRPSQASSPLLEVWRTTPDFSSSPVQSIPAHLSEVHHRPLKLFASPLKLPTSPGFASAQLGPNRRPARPGPLRPGSQARRSPSKPGAMAMACQAGRPALPPVLGVRAKVQPPLSPIKLRRPRPRVP
jgi:hypothetical protein